MAELNGKYTKMEKVGEGTYGVVYKAEGPGGKHVALKTIRLEAEDEGIPSTAIREIALLKELDHPNIVKLCDVLHENKKLIMVFEFLDQDLSKLLRVSAGGLEPELRKSYLYQMLKGLTYCHARKVLHRDLKPQNLLINHDGSLKLADFGLARAFGIPVRIYTHEVVTLWYRAPDVLLGSRMYSTPVDIWSCGCIFYEMVIGRPLFAGASEQDQLHKIFELLGMPSVENWKGLSDLKDYWEHYSSLKYEGQELATKVPDLEPAGIQLLGRMLRYDPESRVGGEEACKDEYFQNLPEELVARCEPPKKPGSVPK